MEFRISFRFDEMYFWLIVTALLWGLTDPLLKRFGQHGEGLTLLANWKYTLTFLANQCGSLTYILAVQGANLSVAVPVANGLKFAFTYLTGRLLLGEKELSWTKSLGVILAGLISKDSSWPVSCFRCHKH